MNIFLRSTLAVWILLLASGSGFLLSAQNTNRQTTPPDNTRTNQRDRDKSHPTAGQQSGNSSDLQITRDIRRALTSDKSLSTYAKNIKIITQNGNVTLRGPVRSEQDKQAIEAKANEVAPGHVKSEIQIAAKGTGKKSGKRTTNN